MALLKRKKPRLLGIDISSTSVKLLELARQDKHMRVESYAVEPLPANAVVEKNIVEPDAVTEAVRRAKNRSNTKLTRCALAVPASAVISKTISMPGNLTEYELEGQIELEADQYIPYAREEVNLDFETIGTNENNTSNLDVLVVASRSENVEIRVGAVEGAKLETAVVDVESYAMANAFELFARENDEPLKEKTIAVIDYGATMTSISIIDDGKLIYTREQSFGGKQLTDEIMKRYSLNYEEAGLAKREGGLPDSYIPEILDPFKETMSQQAHRLLQFFFAASQQNSIDEVVLAGGTSAIPGAQEVIERKLGTRVRIANPFANMSMSSRVDSARLTEDAPALMIAAGLCMRSFD